MKKNNSIKYIIVITLLLLFVGAPFFNWIATNKWQWRFINENNYDAWIGYYGAIIGGALTLGGVWWTIKDQENQRKNDYAIQYKPILNINGRIENIENMYYRDLNFGLSYSTDGNNTPEYIDLNQTSEYDLKFNFPLENIGRGCVSNGNIKELTIENPEFFDNHLNGVKCNISICDLVPNQKIALVLHLPGLLRLNNNLIKQFNTLSTTINCIIEYADEFNVHQYKYNIFFTISMKIRETSFQSGIDNVSIIAPMYYIDSVMPILTQIK